MTTSYLSRAARRACEQCNAARAVTVAGHGHRACQRHPVARFAARAGAGGAAAAAGAATAAGAAAAAAAAAATAAGAAAAAAAAATGGNGRTGHLDGGHSSLFRAFAISARTLRH